MPKKNKTAIVVIAYNTLGLLDHQAKCIEMLCKDDYDLIVVNNSDHIKNSEIIENRAKTLNCIYLKTRASTSADSNSHAFACNVCYNKLQDDYSIFCFLDHDNFPLKPFSPKELLNGKTIAGLEQVKGEIKYFWPGCVMWDNNKVDHSLVDFSVSSEFGLDSGGNFFKIIEKHGKDQCVFFNESYRQNPYFDKSRYNFYAMINDGMFMHFINSSNWNNSNENDERINTLLRILEENVKFT